ncbi:hypothetical protein EDB81DRAFT_830545, partial [Dactylonectria macrodidyma]
CPVVSSDVFECLKRFVSSCRVPQCPTPSSRWVYERGHHWAFVAQASPYPLNPYPLPPTFLPSGLSFCSFVPMRTRRYDLPLSVSVHLLHNVWCYQAFAILAQASLLICLSAQRRTLFALTTIPFHGPSNYDKAGDDTRRARQTHVKRHTTHV